MKGVFIRMLQTIKGVGVGGGGGNGPVNYKAMQPKSSNSPPRHCWIKNIQPRKSVKRTSGSFSERGLKTFVIRSWRVWPEYDPHVPFAWLNVLWFFFTTESSFACTAPFLSIKDFYIIFSAWLAKAGLQFKHVKAEFHNFSISHSD